MSATPFNPNDQSTWPTAKDIRKFEKTIETVHPSGQVDRVHYKVDPNSPADIAAAEADQAKHYVRQRLTREPNSPEAQAFFLAEMEEIRRGAEEGAQLREAALAAEHARIQANVAAASTSPAIAVSLLLEGAAPSGSISAEHVRNVMARLNTSATPEQAETALQLTQAPKADTARYDRLRPTHQDGLEVSHA